MAIRTIYNNRIDVNNNNKNNIYTGEEDFINPTIENNLQNYWNRSEVFLRLVLSLICKVAHERIIAFVNSMCN